MKLCSYCLGFDEGIDGVGAAELSLAARAVAAVHYERREADGVGCLAAGAGAVEGVGFFCV